MKLLIVTALTLIATSSVTEAAVLPRVLETKIENLALKSAKHAAAQWGERATANSCIDFSGKYAGACTANGKTEPVSFTLVQDGCKSLKIDEDTMNLGAHGVVGVGPEPGTFVAASFNNGFTPDGQAIFLHANFTADVMNHNLPIGGRVFSKAHLNGNELVMNGVADIWLATDSIAKVQFDCSLQKQ